ncbi:MAG: rhomboid family intramembrane serine protease [Planctomycetes bacterium]|nr:rhomboid family intramembrane serine protease [Planctomycetota bacterium]
MFIPLGTDQPLNRTPIVSRTLVGVNVAVFALVWIVAVLRPEAQLDGAQSAVGEIVGMFSLSWKPSEPWRLVTYAFMHGGFWHLLGNMFFLYAFGATLENRIGRWGFAALYFAGIVVSGGVQILVEKGSVIGASGAVAAITGCFLVLFPLVNIRVLLVFFLITVFEISALWLLGFVILKDLVFQGFGVSDSVARMAHLAGYGLGIGVGLVLLGTGLVRRQTFDLLALMERAKRKQEIRSAVGGVTPTQAIARAVIQQDRAGAKKTEQQDSARLDAVMAALANSRLELSQALSTRDVDQVPRKYDALLKAGDDLGINAKDAEPRQRRAVILGRDAQFELGNIMVKAGRHDLAATAYKDFLFSHERDPQAGEVRLMLALVLGRYLHRKVDARAELERIDLSRVDAEHREVVQQLKAELA